MAVNIDYSTLENFLMTERWKEADQETLKVMLRVCNEENKGWLRLHDLHSFSCNDLRIIDELWLKYSQKKFGFSVQKLAYHESGGVIDPNILIADFIPDPEPVIWELLGKKIGWRVNGSWIRYSDVKFDTSAPAGHLPALCWGSFGGYGAWHPSDFYTSFSVLTNKIERCMRGLF